ncbi:MAG: hypothetical protein ACRDPY_41020 [Streptosporangiaceae bacterium]
MPVSRLRVPARPSPAGPGRSSAGGFAFGVAMYCGFGRQPGADGTQTMREHAEVVRSLRVGPTGS